MEFEKFVDRLPSAQNAVDIFKDRWASTIPSVGNHLQSGNAPHFTMDNRPYMAAQAFGDVMERLDGFDILELGPLEGGHTYQLELLGAAVTAIEGNTEAFLKCLIVKELLNLKSKFYLGDFVKYLESSSKTYDMIFASGVLYHMPDPATVIKLICERTDKCFVWMHYWTAGAEKNGLTKRVPNKLKFLDMDLTYYNVDYGDTTSSGRFWGGLESYSSWMEKDEIELVFRRCGFTNFKIVEEAPDHPSGPCFSFVTHR